MRESSSKMSNTKIRIIVLLSLCMLFFILRFFSKQVSVDVAIPDDAIYINGHYYYVYNIGGTWDDAKTFCESKGGYLAVISSKEENDALYNAIMEKGYTNAYFGYSDATNEGEWKWVSGEASNYTNWHSGEPNGENSNEDFAMFYWQFNDGTWNDGDFGKNTNSGGTDFICEWSDLTDTDEDGPLEV